MGSQFIRAECYASVRGQAPPPIVKNGRKSGGYVGKPRRGKLSAAEIIAEATREHGAAPHVPHPKPPNCLFGETAEDLPLWLGQLEELAAGVKVEMADGRQRKQRKDTPILMGVVASYPGKADETDELYLLWREKTLDYLKEKYGKNLVSVLEHTDEEYGHIHAFVSNKGHSVKPLHDGFAAQAAAAEEGRDKKAQSEAFKQGGRAFQDDFQAKVGIVTGLARIGPARPRLTRDAWQAEKQANKARALAMAEADRVIKASQEASGALALEMKEIQEAAAKVANEHAAVMTYKGQLEEFHEKLNERVGRVGEREKLLDQEQEDIRHNKGLLQRGFDEILEVKKLFLKAYDMLPFNLKPMFEKFFEQVKTVEDNARLPASNVELENVEKTDKAATKARKIRPD